jgi:8-oxo-dGTP pyrophosphatase MutT (NUDIX family)
VETAVREAREETGLELATHGLHLGRLSFVAPRTPRLPPLYITPHVFAVPGSSTAIPDPGEVEEVLWIPLGILASPAVRGEVTIRFGDESRDFPALRIDNRIVWGLTHRILTEFLEVIEPLEGLG